MNADTVMDTLCVPECGEIGRARCSRGEPVRSGARQRGELRLHGIHGPAQLTGRPRQTPRFRPRRVAVARGADDERERGGDGACRAGCTRLPPPRRDRTM